MEEKKMIYEEKEMKTKSGMGMLLGLILLLTLSIGVLIGSCVLLEEEVFVVGGIALALSIIAMIVSIVMLCGLKVINPNEAVVFTLFGSYVGTLKREGFYWVNPFCSSINPTAKMMPQLAASGNNVQLNQLAGITSSEAAGKKISLKAITLENGKQKVNDQLGNPIEIGAIVIWKVKNPTQAVFNVDNYKNYISTQCDSIIRNVARCYPYDTPENEESDEKSLRGSSQEVADIMKKELQEKVEIAGIEILEVRITHLSYAPEIASAMLQRQQAVAIIAARQKIVEGAVSMVDMALRELSENNVVELDDERKAAMVSNLLVVLCGNKDAQPIVNSGSIY